MRLQPLRFWLLTAATVLIAAAGYAINDYYDRSIDAINKPQLQVIGKGISPLAAMIVYGVLTLLGLSLSLLAALPYYAAVLMPAGCAVLLFWYSNQLKRLPVWGNLAVALLSALAVILLWVYEPGLNPFVNAGAFVKLPEGSVPNPWRVLLLYALFAFLLTWMRELTKDLEDRKGDAAEGCRTLPIVWGVTRSLVLLQLLGLLALLPLALACGVLLEQGSLLGWYVLLMLLLPLLFWVLTVNRRVTPIHFHRYSTFLKLIMLAGVGSLFVYRFYYG